MNVIVSIYESDFLTVSILISTESKSMEYGLSLIGVGSLEVGRSGKPWMLPKGSFCCSKISVKQSYSNRFELYTML